MKFIDTLLKYEQDLTGNTKNELAKHIGVTTRTLNKWIIKEARPRKKIYLERMVKFFQISYDDFIKIREQEALEEFNLTLKEFIQMRRKEKKED